MTYKSSSIKNIFFKRLTDQNWLCWLKTLTTHSSAKGGSHSLFLPIFLPFPAPPFLWPLPQSSPIPSPSSSSFPFHLHHPPCLLSENPLRENIKWKEAMKDTEPPLPLPLLTLSQSLRWVSAVASAVPVCLSGRPPREHLGPSASRKDSSGLAVGGLLGWYFSGPRRDEPGQTMHMTAFQSEGERKEGKKDTQ